MTLPFRNGMCVCCFYKAFKDLLCFENEPENKSTQELTTIQNLEEKTAFLKTKTLGTGCSLVEKYITISYSNCFSLKLDVPLKHSFNSHVQRLVLNCFSLCIFKCKPRQLQMGISYVFSTNCGNRPSRQAKVSHIQPGSCALKLGARIPPFPPSPSSSR